MTKLRDIIRRYTTISSVIHMLREREFTLLDPKSWDDRNDSYFMSLYKQARGVGGLYAACAAACSETYHHWRVFTGTADGACIEIDRKLLEAALGRMPGVRFGPVEYLRLDQVEALDENDVQRLPFVKRFGFKPEDEYRIIAEKTEPQQPVFSLPLRKTWIKKIWLNPWLPLPIAQSMKATLHEIPGFEKLAVSRSHLIESTRWKKAGDFVVKKRMRPARQFERADVSASDGVEGWGPDY